MHDAATQVVDHLLTQPGPGKLLSAMVTIAIERGITYKVSADEKAIVDQAILRADQVPVEFIPDPSSTGYFMRRRNDLRDPISARCS